MVKHLAVIATVRVVALEAQLTEVVLQKLSQNLCLLGIELEHHADRWCNAHSTRQYASSEPGQQDKPARPHRNKDRICTESLASRLRTGHGCRLADDLVLARLLRPGGVPAVPRPRGIAPQASGANDA